MILTVGGLPNFVSGMGKINTEAARDMKLQEWGRFSARTWWAGGYRLPYTLYATMAGKLFKHPTSVDRFGGQGVVGNPGPGKWPPEPPREEKTKKPQGEGEASRRVGRELAPRRHRHTPWYSLHFRDSSVISALHKVHIASVSDDRSAHVAVTPRRLPLASSTQIPVLDLSFDDSEQKSTRLWHSYGVTSRALYANAQQGDVRMVANWSGEKWEAKRQKNLERWERR